MAVYSRGMAGKNQRTRPIPPGAPGHPLGGGPRPSGKWKGPRPKPGKATRDFDAAERPDKPPRATARPSKPTGLAAPAPKRRLSSGVAFLHEDSYLIAVDKPAGLPVIAPEGSRAKSLYDIVTERIHRRNPKGRAAVVHRLDRDSSGVLVFATTASVKKVLMSRWDKLARERTYEALVEGNIEEEGGRIESWLAEAGPSRMRVAEPGERGALKAITDYRVLGRGQGYSLLELSLQTGRKHQIRVQLASEGHPIAGDERYGSRRDPAGRLCLHAVRLVLEHPVTGEVLRFESPAPPEFAAALGAAGKALSRRPAAVALHEAPLAPARPEAAARPEGRAREGGPGRGAQPRSAPAKKGPAGKAKPNRGTRK